MHSRRRLLSARSAIVLGVLVFALTIAGLPLIVSASHGAGRDQQADASGWLASVDYEQASF